jgi:hypothetical protein
MAKSNKKIEVLNLEINLQNIKNEEYISLTDIARYKNRDEPKDVIKNWLRSKSTIEYLGLWERIYNENFKGVEFDSFKKEAGSNSFTLSPLKWIEKTKAIGITAKRGRFDSGTFAHIDIALEFATWVSPEFKIYLIKEYKRLKEEETNHKNLSWNVQRMISKINFKIHTDAIKEKLIPTTISKEQAAMIYANEADLLNVALFGLTAQQWKDNNPTKDGNVRDEATLEQLVVLSNMESINALLIQQNHPQSSRIFQLNQVAITQMKSLLGKLESKLPISKNEKDCK